jgi:hypothetical protein
MTVRRARAIVSHPPVGRVSNPPFSALALVVCSGLSATCNPLDPSRCFDGRDGLNRGPIPHVVIDDCSAVGIDLQCLAERRETGYCTGPPQDVTRQVTWTSSDPSVATFGAAGTPVGYLKTLATGEVQVTVVSGFTSSVPRTFFVSPDSGPQQDVGITVWVRVVGTNEAVQSAFVELRPPGSAPLSGETDSTGRYRFPMFRSLVGGPVELTVSKTGYVTVHLASVCGDPRLCTRAVSLTPIPAEP